MQYIYVYIHIHATLDVKHNTMTQRERLGMIHIHNQLKIKKFDCPSPLSEKRVLPIIEKKSECEKTPLFLTYVPYGIYLLSSYEVHYTSTSATHVELFRHIFRNL